jgi:uncharacterized RDD family membrane protein YckC
VPNSTASSATYPGKDLGLPESGPRSVARLGRRIAAIAIDWAIATFASFLITRPEDLSRIDGFITLAVFAALQIIFIATVGGSIGHLFLGLRVVPMKPAWIGVLKPVIRTVLICLVVPAVIWDKDQRGLHDRLAGTVLVRRSPAVTR